MPRGRKPKEVIEEKKQLTREDIIRAGFAKCLEDHCPEDNVKFNVLFIMRPNSRDGWLKDYVPDLQESDRRILDKIMQDMKRSGELHHIGGIYWARVS